MIGSLAGLVRLVQALLHEDGRQTAYVQVRGSIPLLWSSPVCMKYTPKVGRQASQGTRLAALCYLGLQLPPVGGAGGYD